MSHPVTHTGPPLHLAAPAPIHDDEDDEDDGALLDTDKQLHALCEAWAGWCRTRRFYAPPATLRGTLGRLRGKSRPLSSASNGGGPDAFCSADLAALHLAIIGQPNEALDRRVFELYYVARVSRIKSAAAAVGISRQHWYRLLREFRRRVYAASREILSDNIASRDKRDAPAPPVAG